MKGRPDFEHGVIKAKVGMKVHVFSPDKKKYLGIGKIIRVEKLTVEETGEVLSENYPIIQLEDGTKTEGLKCWWGKA